MNRHNSSRTHLPRARPPLERMLRIHQAIQSGTYPNATALAGQLEVSTKSIYRDIEFMRDRLEIPVEFDGARNGYHYTQPLSAFPTLQITEGELFALLVAEKALQQYRGTTFEKPLVSAFNKMAASLPDTVSLNLDVEQLVADLDRRGLVGDDRFEVLVIHHLLGVRHVQEPLVDLIDLILVQVESELAQAVRESVAA